ncbi:hypothetical protein TTRE_0000542801 [Trichuris trichiura]|uniref:Uncharacterized protein n=1 Tax=Trichuris trichiura TaxID=36087 RepID=A0A077ZA94_TRITR|nr:hypothetical protein TTRE_0000542801 [Trichuris trichiura]
MKKADKPVSSLESPGADWNAITAHQIFCELLDRLRIQSEGLFSLLRGEHISPNESRVPNVNSPNIGTLESRDLTSSSSKTSCDNGSSKMELHNERQPEFVKSTEADNVESIFTDGNLVESYFRAYRVSLAQRRRPDGRRRPIVMDGGSCGTLVELLCGVRYFLREGHCVIALLPEKTFTRWCRNSLTSSECLLWMKFTGLLSPIASQLPAVENADLVIDSDFNNVLLKLAYLTGGVLLSNRRLLSFERFSDVTFCWWNDLHDAHI